MFWRKFDDFKNLKELYLFGITFDEKNNQKWSDRKLLQNLYFNKCNIVKINSDGIEKIENLFILNTHGSDSTMKEFLEKSKKIDITSDNFTLSGKWVRNGGDTH